MRGCAPESLLQVINTVTISRAVAENYKKAIVALALGIGGNFGYDLLKSAAHRISPTLSSFHEWGQLFGFLITATIGVFIGARLSGNKSKQRNTFTRHLLRSPICMFNLFNRTRTRMILDDMTSS